MEGLRTYIFSVCGAAILCMIANKFMSDNGTSGAIGKLFVGLFLLLTVIRPVASLHLNVPDQIFRYIESESQDAVQTGQEQTYRAMAEIIKSKTSTYILERANALRANISVDVVVSGDVFPRPEKIYLYGAVSPIVKQQLQKILEQDLGVSKENQIWT